MRWILAVVIITSLWLYGGYLFITDGRTAPITWRGVRARIQRAFSFKGLSNIAIDPRKGAEFFSGHVRNTLEHARDAGRDIKNPLAGSLEAIKRGSERVAANMHDVATSPIGETVARVREGFEQRIASNNRQDSRASWDPQEVSRDEM